MSVQQQQTLFDIFGEIGLPIELILLNVLRTIIATFGILLNSCLVYVTAKSKKLNSPCHLLIAFECFVSGWYQLSSWASITVLFGAGHQFIPIRPCCLQIIPTFLFGFTSSFTAIYLISLDRLISVLFPIWYNQRENSKKIHIILMIVSTLICGLIFVYSDYKIVYTVSETMYVYYQNF
uniref:G_PROTEIN_RECEP_F1_2 domain-containing protein n=1 Tax=Meloidogyne hapla TaxID=6305 RepID=A0A1I8B6C9_MELHA